MAKKKITIADVFDDIDTHIHNRTMGIIHERFIIARKLIYRFQAQRDELLEALEDAVKVIDTMLKIDKNKVDAVRELHPKEPKLPYMKRPPIEDIEQTIAKAERTE